MPSKSKGSDDYKLDVFLKLMGRRIRTLRQERGLSQLQLGVRAGLDQRYLGFIEQGRINTTLKTLEKISRALGVHICQLLPAAGKKASGKDSFKFNDRELLQAKIMRHLHKLDYKTLRHIERAVRSGSKR